MIFRSKSTSLSKDKLLPLEPVEVSHAYALEEGNHQKGNVGAAKTIIRDEYSCEEYSEDKILILQTSPKVVKDGEDIIAAIVTEYQGDEGSNGADYCCKMKKYIFSENLK